LRVLAKTGDPCAFGSWRDAGALSAVVMMCKAQHTAMVVRMLLHETRPL
jgi:hypothetical protein